MQEQAEKLKSWKINMKIWRFGGDDGDHGGDHWWLWWCGEGGMIDHDNFFMAHPTYFNDILLFINCVNTIGLYCLDSLVHQFLVSIVSRKTRFGSTCNYVKHRMSILHLLHFGKTLLTRILKDRYSDYF